MALTNLGVRWTTNLLVIITPNSRRTSITDTASQTRSLQFGTSSGRKTIANNLVETEIQMDDIQGEEFLQTLENKAARLQRRLMSDEWRGSRNTALAELDALNWACGVLRRCISTELEQGETNGNF